MVKYGIFDKNTYNMDKNKYMIGIAGSSKVVFFKISETKIYKSTQKPRMSIIYKSI